MYPFTSRNIMHSLASSLVFMRANGHKSNLLECAQISAKNLHVHVFGFTSTHVHFDNGIQYSHTPRTLRACSSQSGFRKLEYAKVARVHYFCTIALRTPHARVGVA